MMNKPESDVLTALRSRFDEAAKQFPEYLPNVMYLPSQGLGPRIRRYDVRKLGSDWYSVARDQSEEPVLLDDPERLEYARKDEDAFWRFQTLAKELEPALRQCGVKLLDGANSTPDGRVLFWAIGETPPANRAAVAPNDNAFYLVSLEIDRLLRSQVVKESENYVSISAVWSERFPGKRYRSEEAKAFLEEHNIRYRKPRKNRLDVHAADWQRYWAKADSKAFDDLESEGQESLTGDSVETPLFLENAAKMYSKFNEKKRGQ